jgi:hypothetical protein
MNRRAFINRACLTIGAISIPTYGWSQESSYDGPFFVNIAANGGWDTTLMCDPKGRLYANEAHPINRTYDRDDIRTPNASSPIVWAPTDYNDLFFGRYYDRLLVLNGIDLATVNHAVGSRYMGSGFRQGEIPSIGALLAATRAPHLGLTYWSAGGYDVTASHVVRTRVARSEGLTALTQPNSFPDLFNEDLLYQPESDFTRAMAVVHERARRHAETSRLPRLQEGLRNYARSHLRGQGLDRMLPFLPDFNTLQSDFAKQIALGLAGYRAGLTSAMSVRGPGNFDTHDNNDQLTSNGLTSLFGAVDEAWRYIEDQGMADRTIFFITSDLGRTPDYNSGEGKDHWSITSALLMGGDIRGNRVIGGSTHDQRRRYINPETLEVDDDPEVGVPLTPQHIHLELRNMLGISDSPLAQQYAIDTPRIDLL